MSFESVVSLKRIGIVAGEASGDILGASLISALKRKYPGCVFEGIGGDRMKAEGFQSLFAMERLSVMGIVEPLKRLPELLKIRSTLFQYFSKTPPDVFIGIDSPDFNLNLEGKLKACGIPVAHYVSPSVWAWRRGRLKTIARSTDLMLTLFPFEAEFYKSHNIRVECVGHPLADEIEPLDFEGRLQAKENARSELEMCSAETKSKVVALMPGSRHSEVQMLFPVFIKAAELLTASEEDAMYFIIPAYNESLKRIVEEWVASSGVSKRCKILLGNSHLAMRASDLIIMASGTTSLEALLLNKPMIISYRLKSLSYFILKRMVKTKWIGLPNLLANRSLVPELIQSQANPEKIAEQARQFLNDPKKQEACRDAFMDIHQSLRRNAGLAAARAIEQLCSRKS